MTQLHHLPLVRLSLLLALPACATIKPVRVVEPPPALYAAGPTITGATSERQFDDPRDVHALCATWLSPPPPPRYFIGCYIPALDLVVIPSRRGWPSPKEQRQLSDHEWAHARGWRHGIPSLPPVNTAVTSSLPHEHLD